MPKYLLVFAVLWHRRHNLRLHQTRQIWSGDLEWYSTMVVVRAMSKVPGAHHHLQRPRSKPDIDPAKHATVYMRGSTPTCRVDEPQMIKEPLEVEPASPNEKIDVKSRLNFGGLHRKT
ncbi:hypothetical protein Y699_02055 [Aspergillus fumigatus Z5]|nr:hypothetical protein Y699_02055 [Aspergillus fumigatus Z5]